MTEAELKLNEWFSAAFDTILDSYATQFNFGKQNTLQGVSFDEYEKSLYLTEAQKEIIVNLYTGNNSYGEAFETTEQMRRYLDTLITTKVYTSSDATTGVHLEEGSYLFELPEETAFITLEQITYSNDNANGCYKEATASVYPVKQDEYSKVKNNPFRGPTEYKAIRIDSGDKIVEIISKFPISKYTIKYLEKPEPIVLEDLEGVNIEGKDQANPCKVNSLLYNIILRRAVQLALISKGVNVKD